MTLDEFFAGDYEDGFQFELIDGRLTVLPLPNPPENLVERWINMKVFLYSQDHPKVINYVTNKARVIIPHRRRGTVPEPDLAAYHDFPLERALVDLRWHEVSPLLVGEVLSSQDPFKDLVRNAELYLQVPSIKEYWLFDARRGGMQLSMRVHRRHGTKWRIVDLAFGARYATRLLPGFELVVDPRT